MKQYNHLKWRATWKEEEQGRSQKRWLNCPGSRARVYMGGKINLGLVGWRGGKSVPRRLWHIWGVHSKNNLLLLTNPSFFFFFLPRAILGSRQNWEVPRFPKCFLAPLLRDSLPCYQHPHQKGTFMKTDEPMHTQWKRTAKGSLSVHCRGLDKCVVTRTHHDSISLSSFTAYLLGHPPRGKKCLVNVACTWGPVIKTELFIISTLDRTSMNLWIFTSLHYMSQLVPDK